MIEVVESLKVERPKPYRESAVIWPSVFELMRWRGPAAEGWALA